MNAESDPNAAAAVSPVVHRRVLTGWGRTAPSAAEVWEVDSEKELGTSWFPPAEAWAEGDIDLVVVAHGVLPDNESSWNDPTRAHHVVMVNMASAVAVLAAVAARMQDQGHGTIVVLSSMAGQRARRSNFLYGATKAGLDSFASGLGDALRPHGCRVIVVRPGFVHSPMTAGLTPAPFAINPEDVGTAVAAAVRAGHDEVWAPSILRWVGRVLRHLPRSVARRIRS